MRIYRILIFLSLFIFISSLALTGNSDTTYNEETRQYEFKLYFTNPSSIEDNIMFTFSQGVDEDGNEENVVFCEINPIERRLLRSLNIRKLEDVEITANCVYEVIKDPETPFIFDNPEIRGIGVDDFQIEGDFTVSYPKSTATKSTIPMTLKKTIIPATLIATTIPITTPKTTTPITNPKTTIPITSLKTTIPITSLKTTIPITTPKTTTPLTNPKTTIPITTPKTTTPITNPKTTIPLTSLKTDKLITTPKTTTPITIPKTTIPITNLKTDMLITTPKSTTPITIPKTTIQLTSLKTPIPITNLKTDISIINPKTTTPIIIPNKTTNVKNLTPSTSSETLLKLIDQTDVTYNSDTGQYEFKLYFTSQNSIEENIMFTFSQGVDEDGNEENVVFCEINSIERRLLRNLNIRKLDEKITANCIFEVIKEPDKTIIFDNPEIRGIGVDGLQIADDFVVSYPKSKLIKSTILMTFQKSTISVSLIKTTIPITNSKMTNPITNLKTNIPITNSKITIPITNLKTNIPITNLQTTITQKTTTNQQNNTPNTNSKITLKLTDQSDTTYNKETGKNEFKLYFTSPNTINDNIMFTFSQGVDEDGNEENVVFCEINPIERILLNLRNLDEQLTFNCVYDVIKDPDNQLIFDNPEIRGVNDNIEIEDDFKVYYKKLLSSSSIISTINNIKSTIQNSKIFSSTPETKIAVGTSNIKITTTNPEQKGKTSIPTLNEITTIPNQKPNSLLNPSIIISIKNPVISEEIIQTVSTTTPGNNTNNTHLNSAKELIKFNSAGLSSGQICAIIIPCILLLLGAMIAALLLKGGASAAAPAMTNIITPNYTESSSLAKVNLPHKIITQSIQPNPAQPQITTINNPVVNRVFEPITPQNAQIVPVQQVQMVPVQQVQTVPVQEITQVQVPMTHVRGVSSAIGFAGAPQ